MAKFLVGPAIVLALCVSPFTLNAQTTAAFHVCLLTPTAGPMLNGYPTYTFSARIQGSPIAGDDGYWLVAMDRSGATWPQGGGGISEPDGPVDVEVRFGVSNISSYPLDFAIMRTGGDKEFKHSRVRARSTSGEYYENREVLSRLVSPADGCHVTLGDDEVPNLGTCACPH